MRARRLWMMSIPFVTALALTSCSRPPNDTVRMVTSSFVELEDMKAKDYMPQSYHNAAEAYAEAMAEIEMQKQKSPLRRSYSRAGELLSKAKEVMEQAVHQTEDRRDAVAREAADLIEEAKTALVSVRAGLANLGDPTPKKQDIRTELESATQNLKEARDAFDYGDFLSARSTAEDVNVSIVKMQVAIDAGHGR